MLKGASAEELLAALRLVRQGGVAIPNTLGRRLLADYLDRAKGGPTPGFEQLTPREREILRLIAEGRTNKEIAERLYVSVRTVERHRTAITQKLGLHNRAELVSYAVRRGLINHEGE
jgi:two-component system response regulator NreC